MTWFPLRVVSWKKHHVLVIENCRWIVLLFSFLFILTALSRADTKDIQNPTMNQEFKLKVGEQAKIATEELSIKFVSVAEDSRCPKGEQCITQGKGKIQLEMAKGENKPQSIELNTSSGPQEANYEKYTVKLLALDPYPVMNRVLKSEDYVATIAVLDITEGNK
jgi:hypothetical protein